MRSRVSVILAAGASTRMRSKFSKLLHPVLGRSLIHWGFEQAAMASPRLVFVVGHQKNEIATELEKNMREGIEISFAHQDDPRGTADAVRVALEQLSDLDGNQTDVFIMPGDGVLLRKESMDAFIKNHENSGAVLSVLTTELHRPHAYGRLLRDSFGVPEKIVEAKEARGNDLKTSEINSGFYLVQLSALRSGIETIMSKPKGSEFYLTDLISLFRERGLLLRAELLSDFEEMLGVNTQEDLAMVRRAMQARINSHWMSQGVSFSDPSSTLIEAQVQLEADVHLEAGVQLKGQTAIATETFVGAYTLIENTKVGAHCRIESFSHLKDAQIAGRASIGPYARLRPGAKLDEGVHIGNFVEVKKSHLHSGVKANHLTYIGDAEIGKNSNIGAGTITCNYDGFSKNKTTIGAEVFVGSNVSLVAPVEIGDQAIIGAGSVISKNISADALAVERAEQKEFAGGAKRYRNQRSQKSLSQASAGE